jgi:hypothetical protein
MEGKDKGKGIEFTLFKEYSFYFYLIAQGHHLFMCTTVAVT